MAAYVVKVRLRGPDADRILNHLAYEYNVPVETLPRRWWQDAPAKQITVPYTSPEMYRRLELAAITRRGVPPTGTSLRIWTEEA